MPVTRSLAFLITAWAALILASVLARVTLIAAPVSITEGLAWLLLGCGPVAVLVSVFRGPASPTIAQVLYTAEHPADARASATESHGLKR